MGRVLYVSSNSDCWVLKRDPADGRSFVRHEANPTSGGHVTEIGLSTFFAADRGGSEHQALWLIATLTDEEPTAAITVG